MYITQEQKEIKTPYGVFKRIFFDGDKIVDMKPMPLDDDPEYDYAIEFVAFGLEYDIEIKRYYQNTKFKCYSNLIEEEVPSVMKAFHLLDLALQWVKANEEVNNG